MDPKYIVDQKHKTLITDQNIDVTTLSKKLQDSILKFDTDLQAVLAKNNNNPTVQARTKEMYDRRSEALEAEIKAELEKGKNQTEEEKEKAKKAEEAEAAKKAAELAAAANNNNPNPEPEKPKYVPSEKDLKYEKILDDFFKAGKKEVSEAELEEKGINGWTDLGFSGTTRFGKYDLVSAGVFSDNWKIELAKDNQQA